MLGSCRSGIQIWKENFGMKVGYIIFGMKVGYVIFRMSLARNPIGPTCLIWRVGFVLDWKLLARYMVCIKHISFITCVKCHFPNKLMVLKLLKYFSDATFEVIPWIPYSMHAINTSFCPYKLFLLPLFEFALLDCLKTLNNDFMWKFLFWD